MLLKNCLLLLCINILKEAKVRNQISSSQHTSYKNEQLISNCDSVDLWCMFEQAMNKKYDSNGWLIFLDRFCVGIEFAWYMKYFPRFFYLDHFHSLESLSFIQDYVYGLERVDLWTLSIEL
jgi:hypothetical protein